MFEIGFWEIFLIGILALLVIGPERLPSAARTMGYWVGRARRYVEGVKNEVEQEFDVSEFKRLMHNQEVQINELQRKLSGKLDENMLTTADEDVLPKYEFHDDPPPAATGEDSDSAAPDNSADNKDTPSR
jgi:sec-independent protein translocase protein TatB